MIRPPLRTTLFPYTTLFRSRQRSGQLGHLAESAPDGGHASERGSRRARSEEHTSELQSHVNLVCRLLLEKKKRPPSLAIRHSRASVSPFCPTLLTASL